jgi:hypothetical protein
VQEYIAVSTADGLRKLGFAVEMSARAIFFVMTAGISNLEDCCKVSLEESATQKHENISRQRSKELKGPCRRDDESWDHWNKKRTQDPATHKDSEPGKINKLKPGA